MILPSCKDVSKAAAQGRDAHGSWFDRLRAGLHLAICSHCRRFRRQLRLIEAGLRAELAKPVDSAAAAALERAVLARLRR